LIFVMSRGMISDHENIKMLWAALAVAGMVFPAFRIDRARGILSRGLRAAAATE
jgi:hypothetical protein